MLQCCSAAVCENAVQYRNMQLYALTISKVCSVHSACILVHLCKLGSWKQEVGGLGSSGSELWVTSVIQNREISPPILINPRFLILISGVQMSAVTSHCNDRCSTAALQHCRQPLTRRIKTRGVMINIHILVPLHSEATRG